VGLCKPLLLGEIERIVELLAEELAGRMAAQNLKLVIQPEARAYIAKEGFDPVYGARPLKRFMQRALETPIARRIVSGEITPETPVTVSVKSGVLHIQ
jgi:ATP-dependent Clp protease ATP-binding subunit ClpB